MDVLVMFDWVELYFLLNLVDFKVLDVEGDVIFFVDVFKDMMIDW